MNNNKNMNKSRKRAGVSPVIATTIIIAITVTLGLALWAFANTGVGSATQTYSDAVIAYGDYTNDRFVITNVAFDNPAANQVAFWIFNSGKNPTTINNVALNDREGCQVWDPTGLAPAPLTVDPKELKKFYFDSGNDLSSCLGDTFELTVVTDTGATQTFIKKE